MLLKQLCNRPQLRRTALKSIKYSQIFYFFLLCSVVLSLCLSAPEVVNVPDRMGERGKLTRKDCTSETTLHNSIIASISNIVPHTLLEKHTNRPNNYARRQQESMSRI
jgi:hypothetical protein